jgi:hypothetical protein
LFLLQQFLQSRFVVIFKLSRLEMPSFRFHDVL